MPKIIRILLIEDVPEDIKFAEIQLDKILGSSYTLKVCDYFAKALQLLKKDNFDIIILDLSLPDSQGLTNFKKLSKTHNIPIIIYTGLSNEAIKNEAMESGAMDYLIKGKTSNDILKQSILNSIAQYPIGDN
jgi:DNA-binding response OmpR family regulator